jgi:hypothetical protein
MEQEYIKDVLLIIKNKRIVGEVEGDILVNSEITNDPESPNFHTFFNVANNSSMDKMDLIKENKTVLISIKYRKAFKVWSLDYYDWRNSEISKFTLFLSSFEGNGNIKEFINIKKLLMYYL